ncbi:GTPase HflX [Lachnospira pectinoschiza]|uniref:GTPase HflX n=1 Tax=Lachnospira pectinoschiza TaxID=28052 RepID=A0A1G9UCL1_9FIRM|nr:GTPase HflX [Lachnospira pectinoschiza]SDM57691.1 GTP-binding protein HflX [Lachnospira pectinoschiza]
MALYDTDEEIERVILVGVELNPKDDVEMSLNELSELAKTAGAVTVGKMIQPRDYFHPATYIGKGKLDELRAYIAETDATGIICDDELSPAQLRNLEDELNTKVMDRTMVILDIFASRATTSEGKIQVEMAQLKYRSTRLSGLGTSLSRLGGGIGTRGPGEKKIETDRRLIRDRITKLSRDLDEIKSHREVQRSKRDNTSTPVAAIVGYTNAGKSTLLNKLTKANVLSEDKLFATLDPTTRELELLNKEKVLLTDTVGFIRKLPHHLIEAFRSTLEEAKYADIIVHVVDASNEDYERHMQTVYETLEELEVKDKKIITLINKVDKFEEAPVIKDVKANYCINYSNKAGIGEEEFLKALEEIIMESRVYIERTFAYSEAGKIQQIREFGQLLEEEYVQDGIKVKAYVPREIEGRL